MQAPSCGHDAWDTARAGMTIPALEIMRNGAGVLRRALDVVFPPRCVGCGEFETLLCEACRLELRALSGTGCVRCGRPGVVSTSGGWCRDCLGRELGFRSARSAYEYEGVARGLVTALKYGGQRRVAHVMAELAAPSLRALVDPLPSASLTWVPCHPRVERERGYNQAELLARSLAERVGLEAAAPPVRKVVHTRHQQSLGREERARNLEGAFAPLPCADGGAPGSAIVLVDDVYTTGATASHVAAVVSRATGRDVHVFTFARALGELPCFTD